MGRLNQFLVFGFLIVSVTTSSAQKFGVVLRPNISAGAEYHSISYFGGDIYYSAGGGVGLEIGGVLSITEGLSVYSTAGYQQHFAIQLEDNNNFENKSSFTFNKKFFTIGATQKIKISDYFFQGILIGGGINYTIPGKIRITEDNLELGDISYDSNPGFHIDVLFRMRMAEGFYFDPGLRFRYHKFNATSYEDGELDLLPQHLVDLQSSGIELSFAVVKMFGGKNETETITPDENKRIAKDSKRKKKRR